MIVTSTQPTTLPWWIEAQLMEERALRARAKGVIANFQAGRLTVEELRDILSRLLAES
jgi:hypothetical protein